MTTDARPAMRSRSSTGLLSRRYRLIAEVGRGPSGRAISAQDVLLDREVVVKTLDALKGQAAVGRVLRAARAAAHVRHPHVVPILDIEGGRPPFLVLGLAHGRTLADVLLQEGLSIEHALRVTIDVLAGLTALHEGGAVHRDVRSENVLVQPDGSAILTSGGLAEAAEDTGLGMGVAGKLRSRTTPAPSPEQDLRLPADERSDVAAAGALVRTLLGELKDRRLHAVLRRATAEDPDERYPDAGELWAALASAGLRPPPAGSWVGVARGRQGLAVPGVARQAMALIRGPRPRLTPLGRKVGVTALGVATTGVLLTGVLLVRGGEGAPAPSSGEVAGDAPLTPPAVADAAAIGSGEAEAKTLAEQIRDEAAAEDIDLGSAMTNVLDRLSRLHEVEETVRSGEMVWMFGEAAVDAASDSPTADFSAEIVDFLRPRLSVAGLLAAHDQDPDAVGPGGGLIATALRNLDDLQGGERIEEAGVLLPVVEASVDSGTITPEFASAVSTVLQRISDGD